MAEKTRAEVWAEKKAIADQAEKERGGFSIDYEKPEVVATEKGVPVLVRLLGDMDSGRKKGTDAKIIQSTFILADDNKKFSFRYPYAWSKSPLYSIIKVLGEYEWNAEKKRRDYVNEGCPVAQRVIRNSDTTNAYETGWFPSKLMAQNCIDRFDMGYHKTSGKSKILVKSVTVDGDRTFYADGYSIAIYKDIVVKQDEQMACFNDFDVIIKRLDKANRAGDYHEVYIPNAQKPEFLKQLNYGDKDFNSSWSDSLLTEMEQNLELWNFDEMNLLKPSSITYFLKRMESFVKQADLTYPGHHFLEQLTQAKANEKAEWAIQAEVKKKEEAIKVPSADIPKNEVFTDTPSAVIPDVKEIETPKEPVVSRRRGTTTPNKVNAQKYPYYSDLSDQDLKYVDHIDESGDIIYSTEGDLVACEEKGCGYTFSEYVNTCPKCGKKY